MMATEEPSSRTIQISKTRIPFLLFLEFCAVPIDFLAARLAFASVRIFACFVPLVFVVLHSSLCERALEAFLRFCLGDVRLDFAIYDCASKATFATFPVGVFVIQIFRVRFAKVDDSLAVRACL